VKKHKGERHARGFECWTQFVAMLSCQLNKSTLAYANQHRPWEIYREMFEHLYRHCADEPLHRAKRKFRFRNKLLSLDATVIPFCIKIFDWAKYRTGNGAAKLHLLLDHDGYLPKFAALTTGRTGDITVARRLEFEPGTAPPTASSPSGK